MSFVHLHTHSHYSLLDGLPKVSELIEAVKKMGMKTVALTDHGNMYGAIEFYQKAIKAGIKPIIGSEVYVTPKKISERVPKTPLYHLILLVQNKEGYKNLVKLTTIANLEGFYYKPRLDLETIKKYSNGLIGLTACLSGEIPKAILNHDLDYAKNIVKKYLTVFPQDHFYLELQHHPEMPQQNQVNEALKIIGKDLGIGCVATNDVHYLKPEDAEAQDVLLCIQTKKTLTDKNRLSMRGHDFSLTAPEDMAEHFVNCPEALTNTQKIADLIDLKLEFGKYQIPYFKLPKNTTPEAYLKELCLTGLTKRYPEITAEIKKRLDYELQIINKTGYASYFLITQDFINWAKKQGIAVGPGRGSAAGSLVAYVINITDVDPIKYHLLFERFLNPERVSMPDIDTDIADARRDDVLRYVENQYGQDHVAQIITFGTMAARASVRDVGRVMGLAYGYCDQMAKLIPMFTDLDTAIKTVPEIATKIEQDVDAERLMTIAKKLEGVARHTSTHACAVVITKDPLDNMVPLQRDQDDGNIITQYSMDPIGALGLLKMDFLGLKNLTIIERSLEIITATTGLKIAIDNIPLNDKPTFQLLKKANTIGVFQLESSGMRRYLRQLKPTEFEDIIAMVSLYRPGPMEFIPKYIDGKHGRRRVTYIHEKLKPVLEKTYGIAVYQEQVMEIALRLAGFTYGEADVLRKAVGKKNEALLNEQEQKMISGMMKNGIGRSVAKEIWEFILPFARYGFNRSHAACYAMIAYRTAYLKANFPAQFIAALLTADYGNSERIALEVKHARDLGMKVLPPDINESFDTFSVVKESLKNKKSAHIRFGLKAIKNVGDHIVEVMIAERKKHGAYQNLEDFLTRAQDKDLNKKSLESLIKAGALDLFGERNQLLLNLETILQFAKNIQLEKKSGQENLFKSLGKNALPKLKLEPVPEVELKIKLQWEKTLLGLYISGHPLEAYHELIARMATPFIGLKEHPRSKLATVIGVVMSVKKIYTKKGEPMLFVNLADDTAEVEAIVFPKILQQFSTLWQEDAILKITGKVNDKDGTIKLLVEKAERFVVAPILCLKIEEKMPREVFFNLKKMLNDPVFAGKLHVYLDIGEKHIDTKKGVNENIIPYLQKTFGSQAVNVIK